MRLLFKGDFGSSKLQAKVFDDTPVQEFDTLICDAGLNWWWTHMTDANQRERLVPRVERQRRGRASLARMGRV